jgi:hypothetical protein
MFLQPYFGCKSDWFMRQKIFNLSFDWLVLITLYIVVDIFIVITTIIRLLLSLCEI